MHYRGPTLRATACMRDDARRSASEWQDGVEMKEGDVVKRGKTGAGIGLATVGVSLDRRGGTAEMESCVWMSGSAAL